MMQFKKSNTTYLLPKTLKKGSWLIKNNKRMS
ncbi:hypothetical protein M2135_001890 [Parabacteroides sp. PF5-9]|nr:hypothetical protein [Parabacteroides sp. PF5-9]